MYLKVDSKKRIYTMAKKKLQKETDLQELTDKLKSAKSVVFTDYRGTRVKDMDSLRKALRKENVFSKVYKMTLVKKAMESNGLDTKTVEYKTPVILALSQEDESTPARIIKGFTKDIKTISILEGLVEGKILSKVEVEALGSLPSKDQLRAMLLATMLAPVSAFARLLDAYAKKQTEASAPLSEAVDPVSVPAVA